MMFLFLFFSTIVFSLVLFVYVVAQVNASPLHVLGCFHRYHVVINSIMIIM